jgi:hypothetical protein
MRRTTHSWRGVLLLAAALPLAACQVEAGGEPMADEANAAPAAGGLRVRWGAWWCTAAPARSCARA